MAPLTSDPLGLAIDTTFDDTSVAILRGKREVLANLTLSQFKDHEEFGGVVPERASRKHLEAIQPLLAQALTRAGVGFGELDYVAVSTVPGLLGSILVGLTVAKSLAYLLARPLIGINHIEAHPYANVLAHGEMPFPALHLVAAGGHTPYRASCRPPSFINYQCFEKLVVGHQLSDVVAVMGSLNIIAAELDR